jgi:hypothetical protein
MPPTKYLCNCGEGQFSFSKSRNCINTNVSAYFLNDKYSMPTKLFWDKDSKELKAKLDSIIEVENEDNLKTHFRQTILFKDEGKVSGTVGQDNFKLWTHEQGRRWATGIFYPIVFGQFRPLSQGLEIELKSKMNIIGKVVFIAIATLLAYGILTGIVIQDNNEMRFVIPRLLIGTVLFGLMISVPTFIYFKTSKTIKEYLTKELGLRNAC